MREERGAEHWPNWATPFCPRRGAPKHIPRVKAEWSTVLADSMKGPLPNFTKAGAMRAMERWREDDQCKDLTSLRPTTSYGRCPYLRYDDRETSCIRARLNRNYLNESMFRRRSSTSADCSCNNGIESVHHVLTSCSTYADILYHKIIRLGVSTHLPLLLGEVESIKSKRRRISTLAKTGGYLRAIAKRRPNGI